MGCSIFYQCGVVHTGRGLVPIEEVKLGDKVYALDPDTGEYGYYEVVYLTNHPVNEILHLTIDGDIMEVTPDHPIYVESRGWVAAEDVAVGDSLRRKDGGFAQVLAIERVVLDEPEVVYNFTVKGLHTYFVLEVGVLVHNCGGTLEEFASLKNGVYDNSINCISCVLLELPEFQGRKPLVQHRIATSWGDDTAASATDAFTQFRLGNLPDQIELVMQKNFIEIGTDTGGKPLKSLQSGDVITIKQLISKKRDRWDVAHMAIALDGNLAFHKRGIKGPYEIVSLDDIASKHYSAPTTPGIRWQYWRLRK